MKDEGMKKISGIHRTVPLSQAFFDSSFYLRELIKQLKNLTGEDWISISSDFSGGKWELSGYKGFFEVPVKALDNDEDLVTSYYFNTADDVMRGYENFFEFGHYKFPTLDLEFGPLVSCYISPECDTNYFFIRKEDLTKFSELAKKMKENNVSFINNHIFPKKSYELETVIDNTFKLSKKQFYKDRFIPCQLGIVVSGHPGTGKSVWVKYLEDKFSKDETSGLYDCGFYNYSTADMISMAQNGNNLPKIGCIVFDDIEEIVNEREDGPDGRSEIVLPWLLPQLDNGDKDTYRLLIFITNHPDHVDDALLRPGRFDLSLNFDLPSEERLAELFKMHVQNDVPTEIVPELIKYLKKKIEHCNFGHVVLICRLAYTSTEQRLTEVSFWKEMVDKAHKLSPYRGSKKEGRKKKTQVGFGFNAQPVEEED